MSEPSVLVVGAGPTGLLLAIELARRGVRPRVVDASPGPPEGQSRALAVFPRTLEVLERVGAAAALVEAGRRLEGIRVRARSGRSLLRLDLEGLPTPFPFLLSVPQARTESVLLERAEALGVRVERPVELIELVELGEPVRSVEPEDPVERRAPGNPPPGCEAVLRHPDGREERVRPGWIAGCDGAHSTVRRSLGIDFPGPRVGPPFAFSDCRVAGADGALPADRGHAFLAPDGVVATIPLPGADRWRVIATLEEGTGGPEGVPLPFLQDLARARSGLPVTLSEATWSSGFAARQRLAERYRKGRVVLAGDAAHAHSPLGGQGMNTGLRDAFALAWRLALVARGRALDSLLDDYARERRPIGRRVVRLTGLATRGVGRTGRLPYRLREAALRGLDRATPLKRILVEGLTGLREEVRTPEAGRGEVGAGG